MSTTQSSIFPSAPIAGARTTVPEMNMVIDYFVSELSEVCVFHDKPFSKTLSWIEYNLDDCRLDFIMEDGDIRNFGIPVDGQLKPYFQNTHIVNVIQLNPENLQVVDGVELPLIVHSAA